MSEENTESVSAPVFGLAELAFLKQIVETATQRGAFRADEMSTIGVVYDRLAAFLVPHLAKPEEAAAPESTEE